MGETVEKIYCCDRGDKGYSFQIGDAVFCKDLHKLVIWDGTKWVDSNGNNATCSVGSTENRPSNASIGYLYYDVTLKKIYSMEWHRVD